MLVYANKSSSCRLAKAGDRPSALWLERSHNCLCLPIKYPRVALPKLVISPSGSVCMPVVVRLVVAHQDICMVHHQGSHASAVQLHAAVVELWTGAGAEIKYSTVQNWYAGDDSGKGGIYNFVTKRGLCHGDRSKISWTQVGTRCSCCAVCGGHARFAQQQASFWAVRVWRCAGLGGPRVDIAARGFSLVVIASDQWPVAALQLNILMHLGIGGPITNREPVEVTCNSARCGTSLQ